MQYLHIWKTDTPSGRLGGGKYLTMRYLDGQLAGKDSSGGPLTRPPEDTVPSLKALYQPGTKVLMQEKVFLSRSRSGRVSTCTFSAQVDFSCLSVACSPWSDAEKQVLRRDLLLVKRLGLRRLGRKRRCWLQGFGGNPPETHVEADPESLFGD